MERRLLSLVIPLMVAAGCTVAVPGSPVVTPRLLAAAEQVRACSAAVEATTASLDTLLDAIDRGPSGSPADAVAIRRFYDGMNRTLNGGCGYWSRQGEAQSAVLLHLAGQPPARSPAARDTISSMIRSICLAVEGPLDQHGVNLTSRAHEVCVAG